MQLQTDEQRGKRACALTARGFIRKAMTGLVGGAAQGSDDCRRNWTAALTPRSSGIGTHPTSAEWAEAARGAWGGGRYKAARSATRENGRSKKGIASLLHFKLAPMNSGPHKRTAGTCGCHRLLRRSQPQKAGDNPTSKQFDDDEWIRCRRPRRQRHV